MGRFMDEFKDALSAAFFPNLHALSKSNQSRSERARQEALLGHIVTRAVTKAASVPKGRDIQYEDEGYRVEVRSGHHRKYDAIVTDIVIIDRSSRTGEHMHVIVDEVSGQILHQGMRENK